MFKNKSVFAMTVLGFLGFIGASTAKAEDPQCYTVASLKGTYAVVATYGANVAMALALRNFDGQGNLTGTFTLNEPSPGSSTGARTIVTGTQKGTYTVNCDGTGVITRVVTASNGVTATQLDDFLITRATAKDGQFLATALADATRVPSAIVPGGIFVTRSYTRLPDES
jgi:hypothetical protein